MDVEDEEIEEILDVLEPYPSLTPFPANAENYLYKILE